MANIFSGLEAFGLKELTDMEIYGSETSKEQVDKKKKQAVPMFSEKDVIFEKTLTCPCCDRTIKAKTVKTGKVKLEGADTDLRPKYKHVDSLKYDGIVCPNCGYAALRRYFNFLTSGQTKLVKESISDHFKGIQESEEILSYDDAINRHKLALVNAIVKRSKLSERAYTCLKLAWVIRGKAEHLSKDTKEYDCIIKELEVEEQDSLLKAFEGFKEAFSKESFPMCGMDEDTCMYLVAELARRCNDEEEARRWLSRVLLSRTANDRLKEKARYIKELMHHEE